MFSNSVDDKSEMIGIKKAKNRKFDEFRKRDFVFSEEFPELEPPTRPNSPGLTPPQEEDDSISEKGTRERSSSFTPRLGS